jgi:two-component system, NtrC family, sensor kinase
VANLIADVLRDDGMQVEVLQDGRRALEAARNAEYDLAICDLKMPEMDGQGFFGELQQEQNSLGKRILFVTGDVLSARTQEFLERNHLPHLAKPFRVEELSDAVRHVLWGKTRAAAASSNTREGA